MSRESKIANIQKQIHGNKQKIHKLMAINLILEKQILKLKKVPEKPVPPSVEERAVQSQKDKSRSKEEIAAAMRELMNRSNS